MPDSPPSPATWTLLRPTDAPDICPWQSGETYVLESDADQPLDQIASIVWGFLLAARRMPIGLTIRPPGVAPVATDAPPRSTDSAPRVSITADSGRSAQQSWLGVYSSGSTGQPKLSRRSVPRAAARPPEIAQPAVDHAPPRPPHRWQLLYAPHRWAGLSVMLHCLNTDSDLVVSANLDDRSVLRAAHEAGTSHWSLTPSRLRRMVLALGHQPLHDLPLRQITLGGEAADQPVLDLARRLWPVARISHVYATTETGDLCSVSDGLAGIPIRKLSGPDFQFLPDGELVVRGYPTGDLWKQSGDRYQFVGRRQEMINVGGAKVSPAEVEAVVLSLPGVEVARAYAIRSPLLGQLVALDYVGSATPTSVRQHCRAKLPKIAWPAKIEQRSELYLSDADKLVRSPQ
jgi:acyl-CoA synthetase (AMP-forming)/AMP-acid ligase II